MDVKILTSDSKNNEFYPTPKKLVKKMVEGVQWKMVHTILEPSAGKGDILDALEEVELEQRSYQRHNGELELYTWKEKLFKLYDIDIDCVEIDENLQHILKGKGYRVVHDDFLTFQTFKKYDLIIMNPPFSCGDKHLAKALQMQKDGGSVICLLNAETIKNPYSSLRKELVQSLEKYNADIEYVANSFSGAERKTDVEIAIVKVTIPEKKQESDIYNRIYDRMKKAAEYEERSTETGTDVMIGDYIKAIISQFNIEVASGVELIRQFWALQPHILTDFKEGTSASILKLTLDGKHNDVSINSYVKRVRLKYWSALFSNKKFTGNFTSNLIREYSSLVNDLQEYDFSEHNIRVIMTDMSRKMNKSIEEAIMEMFDRLSAQHAWYKESANNIHYYNGWASNKAHKVNKKVILPCYNVFNRWSGNLDTYHAMDTLKDIEKIFDFFDGDMTSSVDMCHVLEVAQEKPKNIECKYFTVTFYRKGTVHITFKNLDLLEKFNIYAAKNRRWLPPDYGKKQYKNMTQEEQAVVDDFQGEEAYNKVMANQSYFLVETQELLQLGC